MQKVIYPYIRFSTSEQSRGDSLRRQLSSIQKYAETYGYVVNDSESFKDLGISAKEGKNYRSPDSGLGRFLNAIDNELIPTDGSAYLTVEQLDRLSREEFLDALTLFRNILSQNVNIITLMDSKVYTKDSLHDFNTIMYSLMVMHQAYLESEKKSQRIKASFEGRLEKIKQGKKAKYASAIPNWLDEKKPKSGKFKQNKHAKTVKRIFRMVLDDISLNEIAIRLNESNTPRITRNNYNNATGIWTGSIISHLVKNRCTIGILDIKKYSKDPNNPRKRKKIVVDSIEDYYPRIISDQDFILANEIVKERRVTNERGRNTNHNLFSSLLYCGDCLQRIHFESNKKKLKSGIKIYKCLKCTSKRFKRGCNAVTLNYDEFEAAVPLSRSVFPSLETLPKKAVNDLKKKISKSESEIVRITQLIEKVNLEILKSEDSDPAYFVQTITKLEKQLTTAKEDLRDAEITLVEMKSEEGKKEKSYNLNKESDREEYKRFLKRNIAAIIVYTHTKSAWILTRGGAQVSFIFGERNINNKYFEFHDFLADLTDKIKNNETIDQNLYKVVKTIKNNYMIY